MPSSGRRQIVSTYSTIARQRGHSRGSIRPSRSSADGHDRGDLAVHVELELLGRRVADPDRPRALVARQVRQLELDQAPLAADAVHDLDRGGIAGPDAQQVVAVRHRLVRVAGVEQRLQREHRVAQPGVAVVPVAHAADLLRQRRRRRRDHRAGLLGGHRLERDQRREHLVAVVALVAAATAPLAPPRLRPRERRVGVLDRRRLLVGEMPGQRQALAAARGDDELGTHRAILDRQRQRRAQPERVRSRGRHDPVGRGIHPWRDRAVVRAQREIHAHRHSAAQALDDPHHARRAARRAAA